MLRRMCRRCVTHKQAVGTETKGANSPTLIQQHKKTHTVAMIIAHISSTGDSLCQGCRNIAAYQQ